MERKFTPSKPAENFVIFEALSAEKPFAAYADKLMLFGQFVGKWAMEIKFYDEAGNRYCQVGKRPRAKCEILS